MNSRYRTRPGLPGWALPACLIGLLLLLPGSLLAATIQVSADPNPARLDRSLTLVFSSEESVDGEPDFAPLKQDFEILGQNQGSQVNIINGRFSKQTQWTLTLMPKRAGAIAIPPIAFGKDRSRPLDLTVLDAGAVAPSVDPGEPAEDIKLEVDAEPRNPYFQAQTIYTLRVLLSIRLAGADLSEPASPDALVVRLGEEDHRYTTRRGGREYLVVERKYAIFPQKTGLARIDPVRLTAQVEDGGRSFFSRSTRVARIKSEAIDLQVRPIPAAFTGSHWLPAADLKLEETWPQTEPRAKAGEPITRTLKLRAVGATMGVLPELGADLQTDASIKQYPDQPSLTEEKLPTIGITATRIQKTALIPGKPGEFKLPAVAIPWWNTQTNRMETARIPERILKVEPSGEAPPAIIPAMQAAPALSGRSEPTAIQSDPAGHLWFWLALLFGCGWLLTAWAWWRNRRALAPTHPKRSAVEPTAGERWTLKTLQQACRRHDAAAAQKALLDWAKAHWPDQPPASLAEVARQQGGKLAEPIELLQRALYGAGPQNWRGEGLWTAVEEVCSVKPPALRDQPGLEPLYH